MYGHVNIDAVVLIQRNARSSHIAINNNNTTINNPAVAICNPKNTYDHNAFNAICAANSKYDFVFRCGAIGLFTIINNAIPNSAYNTIHAILNTIGGGVKPDCSKPLNHTSECPIGVNIIPINPGAKDITIVKINNHIFLMLKNPLYFYYTEIISNKKL